MRRSIWSCLLVTASTLSAEEVSPVDSYLRSGQFNKGEQALQLRLETEQSDDEARFGLGVLQVLRGVERLGQNLHEFGAKGQNSGEMFIRLPVPENPDPSPITYQQFRRMLDDFRRDLALAESTLAGIKDDQVKLSVPLGEISFDLDFDGEATDSLLVLLQRFDRGNRLRVLRDNPQLKVTFDRGDVAWLRAYCHLLMGFVDGYLGVNNEPVFNMRSESLFAKPRKAFAGTEDERRRAWTDAYASVRMAEPVRWHRMRLHFLKAAALNQETWAYIRKETDNDHEWLPNPQQVSMLNLRVSDRMIDAWLGLWDELAALFAGEKVLPYFLSASVGDQRPKMGVNLQRLFDDPPEKLGDVQQLDERYLTDQPEVDVSKMIQWYLTFGNSPVPMALWFN